MLSGSLAFRCRPFSPSMIPGLVTPCSSSRIRQASSCCLSAPWKPRWSSLTRAGADGPASPVVGRAGLLAVGRVCAEPHHHGRLYADCERADVILDGENGLRVEEPVVKVRAPLRVSDCQRYMPDTLQIGWASCRG